MTITEAVEAINRIGEYVNKALRCLQEQKFQQAFAVGEVYVFGKLDNYKAAIGLLIERGRTDLLEQRYRKTYETACEAEPLLEQAISKYSKRIMIIGGIEAMEDSNWATYIKEHWEAVVLPLLQTDAEDVASPTLQTNAEAPHRGRPKDDSILWLVENPDGHLGVLHQLTNGLRGVDFFCFIKAAVLEGWFDRPPYRAIKKEFGDIGSRNRYNFYMGNPYNVKELEQLRATLKLRHQNL